jgi:hypothetical protein
MALWFVCLKVAKVVTVQQFASFLKPIFFQMTFWIQQLYRPDLLSSAKQLSSVAFAASLFTRVKYFQLLSELSLSELVHSGEELDPFWPRKFC